MLFRSFPSHDMGAGEKRFCSRKLIRFGDNKIPVLQNQNLAKSCFSLAASLDKKTFKESLTSFAFNFACHENMKPVEDYVVSLGGSVDSFWKITIDALTSRLVKAKSPVEFLPVDLREEISESDWQECCN